MTLLLDDNHQFCLDESPCIRARILADLEAISEILLEAVSQASIVLSGSLAHGEGRVGLDGMGLESDYDLYVVVPRLLQARSLLRARSRCMQRLQSLMLPTDLEVVVISSAVLGRGLTSVPGILLAGNNTVNPLLDYPTSFRGDRNLCRAYASLFGAFQKGADRGLLQKAVTNGFRAWLLHRTMEGGSLHNEDCFSFRGNLIYLHKHPEALPEPWREMAESALLAGLGNPSPHATLELKTVLAFLKWVQGTIRLSPFRWAGLLYVIFQVKRGRSFISPHRFLSTYLTLARSLAELCSDSRSSSVPEEVVRGIERLAGQSCPIQVGTDQRLWAFVEMITLADANPHKIVIPRRRQTVPGFAYPRSR
jgi:hypothetical protein